MKRIVISQPMFFPWVGLFEQVRLADAYVHYDDVQYSKGSFTNRVQIKTAVGSKWLTVPIRNLRLGQPIAEVQIDDSRKWRNQHRDFLKQAYARSPHLMDMLRLVEEVYSRQSRTIAELSGASIEAVSEYYSLGPREKFCRSSDLAIAGSSSQRVFDIVRHMGGDVYITGHGARNYLDHRFFEESGIRVEYMKYGKIAYQQQHGDFTPFVSILDLIANQGQVGRDVICSETTDWKEFAA